MGIGSWPRPRWMLALASWSENLFPGYFALVMATGIMERSAKHSFGSEPPMFGRIAGFAPVVRVIDSAAHWTQG